MTLCVLAPWLAASWWGAAVLLLLASFIATLLHPYLPWQSHADAPLRPVTAIVPIKYLHADFERDQASLFTQDYPELEILLTSAEPGSEAMAAARRVQQQFPAIASQVLHSNVARAVSPKLNNLWPAFGAARHDLILIKDSNVLLAPGDVEHLVRHHAEGVGLVSTISITTDPGSFGAWIETSIINCYHGRMLMLASALGMGAGCGKIMLFSRADLERAGGFDALAWAIGEDEAMTQAFARIGLRTALSDRTSRQILGVRSLRDIWERQLRWMLIWRFQAPAVFAGEFLASALPAAFAAALAAPLANMAPGTAFAATLALWFVLESLLCLIKGWPFSVWSPLAFVSREILNLAIRFRALTTREVAWGGVVRRVHRRSAA